jgi:hypothetical protein
MPTDPATGWKEPDITINATILTFAEAMTLRVAISNMRVWLGDPEVRRQVGRQLCDNYDANAASIERLLFRKAVA